jgi:three-Cys-motif partner protein
MSHIFGGSWTEEKLAVMKSYFQSYSIALKKQNLEYWYIDAFAGTGERTDSIYADTCNKFNTLDLDDDDFVPSAKEGSALLSLKMKPPFHRYIFIDSNQTHVNLLNKLKIVYSDLNIDVIKGEANEEIKKLCNGMKNNIRAAVFIDPYGMQLNWNTLECLAKTKKVDIALLFPTMALNRVLRKDQQIPRDWQERIDSHLGECNWRDAFYQITNQNDLFGHAKIDKISIDNLRNFIRDRFKVIFPYVHEEYVPLKNSKGSVLYDLFIICANDSDKAHALVKKLANGAIKASKHK